MPVRGSGAEAIFNNGRIKNCLGASSPSDSLGWVQSSQGEALHGGDGASDRRLAGEVGGRVRGALKRREGRLIGEEA